MSNIQKENLMVRGSNILPHNSKQKHPEIKISEPLWKRVPTRDHTGKPYNDFMMIIPGLRKLKPDHIQNIISKIEAALKHYEKDIILADLNLKINVLWVTIQPHIGLSTEIAALIHHLVPEAKLVAQHKA